MRPAGLLVDMLDTILVGVDGSPPSNRAVAYAIDLADQYEAQVHAIYVVDTSRYGEPALSNAEMMLHHLEEEGTDLLADVTTRAEKQAVSIETRCCHGAPADEIIAQADAVDADVIVLGHRGKSDPDSPQIGSVADRVVRHAGHPVFIV